MIMFDVTSMASYKHVQDWYEIMEREIGKEGIFLKTKSM